jgi:hypothetical protein
MKWYRVSIRTCPTSVHHITGRGRAFLLDRLCRGSGCNPPFRTGSSWGSAWWVTWGMLRSNVARCQQDALLHKTPSGSSALAMAGQLAHQPLLSHPQLWLLAGGPPISLACQPGQHDLQHGKSIVLLQRHNALVAVGDVFVNRPACRTVRNLPNQPPQLCCEKPHGMAHCTSHSAPPWHDLAAWRTPEACARPWSHWTRP